MKSQIAIRSFATALLCGLASWPLSAAAPSGVALVKDIQTLERVVESSNPADFVQMGDHVYFAASNPANGRELWKTNGTDAGTRIVRDLIPGIGSSLSVPLNRVLGDKLFFRTSASVNGKNFFVTDGTEAGVQALDLGMGTFETCQIDEMGVAFQARLYVSGCAQFGQSANSDLFASDGTQAGTALIKAGIGRNPQYYPAQSQMFLITGGGSPGIGFVSRTDGTPAGTRRLSRGAGGETISQASLQGGAVLGDNFYFIIFANNASIDGLWVTDGTDAGTVRISTITSDERLLKLGNRLYFMRTPYSVDNVVQHELWTTDGTAAGTVLVKSTGARFNGVSAVFKGELYFGAITGNIRQLWKTDGTSAGTVLVKSFSTSSGFISPAYLTNLNDNILVFRESTQGSALWKTDGTSAGTVKLADVIPGCDSNDTSRPRGIVNVNGVAYFAGQTSGAGGNGCELWKSDGTAAGTVQVKDIAVSKHSDVQNFAEINGKALFRAISQNSDQVWKSDGTSAGTEKVSNESQPNGAQNIQDEPKSLTRVGSRVFYIHNQFPLTPKLHMTDGTPAGTVKLDGAYSIGLFTSLFNLNGQLHFFSSGSQGGLWTSDGTVSGTQRVFASNLLESGRLPVRVNGTRAYFGTGGGSSSNNIVTLYTTDGTEAGTFQLGAVDLDTLGRPGVPATRFVIAPDGRLFWVAKGAFAGDYALIKSDGTTQGTSTVVGVSRLDQLAFAAGTLFLAADQTLRISDGTAAGTVELKTFGTALSSFNATPDLLTAAGDKIFFTVGSEGRGTELWKSDGTLSGTVMVKDICPGPCSSFIRNIYVLPDGDIVFAAAAATGGLELWTSDGTEAGTVQVSDINPGAESSTPENFFVAADKLYFRADNGVNGRELWAATVPQGPTLVANNDEFSMEEDAGPFNFDPRVNDVDSEDAPIIVTAVTQANRDVERFGTVTVQPNGIGITYTPLADFSGNYEFGYTISSGSRTASGRIKVIVVNVNDPPTANDDSFNVPKDANARRLDVLRNDSSQPDPQETLTITAVTQPDKGGVTTTDGVYVYYTPVTSFIGQETFSYTLSDGLLTDVATVTTNVQEMNSSDTSPDPFSFTPRTGVACSTEFTSDPISVSGVDDLTPISVSGGQYSVNGGAFRSDSGLVENGDSVRVKVMSSNLASTTTSAFLNIGDQSASYSVTTAAQGGGCNVGPPPDVSPDAFVFVDKVDVPTSTLTESEPVIIRGINQAVPISIAGGEYRIGLGVYTSAAGTVTNNSQVTVRHASAANGLTATNTTLTVGDKSDTFTSTTVPPGDRSPNLFIFNDLEGVPRSSVQTSNEVTISGLGSGISVPLTVMDGSYSLDGGAFTTAAGTAVNGSRIRARHTSAATFSAAVNTRITVGEVSDVFTSVTLRNTSSTPNATPPDTTPIAFRFTDVTEVPRGTRIESNSVTIDGMEAPTSISVNNGEYSIDGGAYTSANGTIANGRSVKVRQLSSTLYATATDTTLTVGGVSDVFTTITESNASSNASTTADAVGQPVEVLNSNGRISGLRSQPAPVNAPSRYYYPNGFFSFRVREVGMGGRSTVVMRLPPSSRPSALVRCSSRGCAEYPATINDNVITYELQDGSDAMGDNDGMVNGEIDDPMGPAFLPSVNLSINDVSGRPVTVSTSAGLISNLRLLPAPLGASSEFQYPNGFIGFDVINLNVAQAVQVTLQLPPGSGARTFFACRPGLCEVLQNLSIAGDTVTLNLVDGGPGDNDGRNGTIRIIGAPGRTDGGGGALALPLLLVLGVALLWRRQRAGR